jgi:DNA-binding NarL/FixJ family response regulator
MPTVLVIDDDPLVAVSVRDAAPGWTVLEATDGAAGIATVRAQRDRLDMVLLDLMMPHDGGMTCVQIRTEAPLLRVLPITGGAPAVILDALDGLGCLPPLYKPASPDRLRQALYQALAQPCPPVPVDPLKMLPLMRELAARSEYSAVQQRAPAIRAVVLASSLMLRTGLHECVQSAGGSVRTATTSVEVLRAGLAELRVAVLVADSAIAAQARELARDFGLALLVVARTLRSAYRLSDESQGIIIEPITPLSMAQALRALAAGERYRDPVMELPLTAELTKSEHEVLIQLLRGTPIAAIATNLHIQPNSVHKHRSSIYAKVGVEDMDELWDWLESQQLRRSV